MKHVHTGLRGLAAAALCTLAATAPQSFAEDAYVASSTEAITTGNSYSIDTGYFVGPNTRIDADFEFLGRTADCSPTNTYQQFVYACEGSFVSRIYLNGATGDGAIAWSHSNAGNWTSSGVTMVPGVRYRMRVDPVENVVTLSADGVVKYSPSNPFGSLTLTQTSTRTLKLFNAANAYDHGALMKLYGCKIYESGELVRDYVPAVKGRAPGLYDRVNGGFITNFRPTYRALDAGGDLLEVEDDPCIISDGTAQTGFNSGYFWGPKSRIEIEYAFDAISPYQMRVFGADGAVPCASFYLNGVGNASFGFDNAAGTAFDSLSTGSAATTRRYFIVADQPTSKAYYSLVTGVSTNQIWSGNIKHVPTATATRALALFGNNQANPAGLKMTFVANNNSAKARIYRARFFTGGVLVRDLVPLVKGGVPGFRDLVSGDFLSADRDAILPAFSASPTTPTEPDDAYVLTSDFDQIGGTTNYMSYIDTGYTATTDTRIDLDFAWATDYPQSGFIGNHDWMLFAARNGSGAERFTAYFNKSGFGYCYGSQNWLSAETPNLARLNGDKRVRHTIVMDGPNKTLAMITAGYTNSVATLPEVDAVTFSTTLKIGSHETGGSNSPLKVYGFKIYEAGQLKHSYEPRVQGGVAGFLDTYGNGGFHTGAAKVALSCGGAIESVAGSAADAYIESDGTQAISTGVTAKPESCYEVDYQFTRVQGQARVFGTAQGTTANAELYINGSSDLAGNLSFGHGAAWGTGGANGFKAADVQRHTATFDLHTKAYSHDSYSGTIATVTEGTSTYPLGLFAKTTNVAGTTFSGIAKMRLYAFRIYEYVGGVKTLQHEFVPYKNGDTVGLYDTVTGDVKVNGVSGATAFKIGGMGVDGAEKWLKDLPAEAAVATESAITLTAAAAGAVRYEWTLNGEVVEGATGESVTAAWRKGGYSTPDIYTCTAIYDVYGTETRGTPVSCAVTRTAPVFVMVVR